LYSIIYAVLIGLPILLAISGGLWLGYLSGQAQPVRDQHPLLGPEIRYKIDQTNALEIKEILSKEEDFETLQEGTNPNFGFNASNIWLLFDVDGKCVEAREKIIEIKNPLLNEIEVYEILGDSIRLIGKGGDKYFFSARANQERNYCFAIDLPSERVGSFCIKLNSGGEQLLAPIVIWTKAGLAQRNSRDQMLRGSYFGLLLFILFFNLFIYFIIREKSSLYYVYYNLFLILLQLALGGYAFQYLWPGAPYFANMATPLFATLSVYALIRFSQEFLQIRSFFPRANWYFQMASYLLLANLILCVIPNSRCFQISILIVNGTALLLNFAIIPTAIGVIRRNFKPAKIFLAAFLLLVLTVFGFLATNIGLLRSDFFADYGLLIGSAAEVILLSLAIVVRFKSFKDDALKNLQELNAFQAEQNTVLEEKVLSRTAEIEQKKEEILSSIRYAERIQKNVLPSHQDLSQLFPHHFIIYQPKDIVSGDFYWAGQIKNKLHQSINMFATADCTGHGVPGAMVSVLGCNLLRETVMQYPDERPNEMLHRLEERLLLAISGTDHEHAGDGMDIALCGYNENTKMLTYSGAHINLHIKRGNEWTELKATRRPIGLRQNNSDRKFEHHEIQIIPGDILYAWTDGLPDMMGGVKGKKWKTSGVLSLLKSISGLPLPAQKNEIETFINTYQMGFEQVDDITFTCIQF
jgi:two-component system, sensor histidine kinase LadS